MNNTRRKTNKLTLENTRLVYRSHFTDEPDNFGNTSRYFNVYLDEDNPKNKYGLPGAQRPLKIEDLVNDGWNVKFTKATEDYESVPFIKVNVAYRNRDGSKKRRTPLVIKQIGGPDYKVTVDEESIGDLDIEYIENIDYVDINAYEYEPGKVSGYLVNMCLTVEDDPFLREYGDAVAPAQKIEEDDLPF